jgi:hypothetical protein
MLRHHAKKEYWRSGGIAPRILILCTRWRWVVSFTPRLLYDRGRSLHYIAERRPGGPQNRSGRDSEEKNPPPPGRDPKPGRPARSLVTILTELPRLLLVKLYPQQLNIEISASNCCRKLQLGYVIVMSGISNFCVHAFLSSKIILYYLGANRAALNNTELCSSVTIVTRLRAV